MVGTTISLATQNELSDRPDAIGLFAAKVVGLFAWGVVLIGGVVLLLEWVEPFWLALLLTPAYFAVHFLAIKWVIRWEDGRANDARD